MWGRIKLRKDDILFSKFLRNLRLFICEKCGRYYPEGKGLSVSHFWGRRHESVRFDLKNTDCLCFNCHRIFEEDPPAYVSWKLDRLGQEEFDKLKVRAHLYCKKDVKKNVLFIKQIMFQEGIEL